jgi:hypothetical protein
MAVFPCRENMDKSNIAQTSINNASGTVEQGKCVLKQNGT